MSGSSMWFVLVGMMAAGLAIQGGCSGSTTRGPATTGASGGAAAGGVSGSGGAKAGTGGAPAGTGGAVAGSGGAAVSTGGAVGSTGGTVGSSGGANTGGAVASTGGAVAGTGGAPTGKGGAAGTQGNGGGAGAGGVAAPSGGGGAAGKGNLGGMTAAGGAGMCPSSPACAAPHLVPTSLPPDLLSVTATHFYYVAPANTGAGQLWRIGLDGANQQQLYSGGLAAVAIDPAETAAYLGLDGIYKLPLDSNGAAGSTIQLDPHPSTAFRQVTRIAVDGATIYYSSNADNTDPSVVGGLFKIPAAGGSPTQILKADSARNVAIHGDYVYFSGDLIQGTNGVNGIVQLPRAGGTAKVVYDNTGGLGPDRFFVTDDAIYVDNGNVVRIPLAGGSPVTLFAPTSDDTMFVRPSGFTVGTDAIYFGATVYTATATLAEILRIPLDGGAVSTPFFTDAFVDVGYIVPAGGNVYFGSTAKATPGILEMNACGCAP